MQAWRPGSDVVSLALCWRCYGSCGAGLASAVCLASRSLITSLAKCLFIRPYLLSLYARLYLSGVFAVPVQRVSVQIVSLQRVSFQSVSFQSVSLQRVLERLSDISAISSKPLQNHSKVSSNSLHSLFKLSSSMSPEPMSPASGLSGDCH